jgi:hypothetical protein
MIGIGGDMISRDKSQINRSTERRAIMPLLRFDLIVKRSESEL